MASAGPAALERLSALRDQFWALLDSLNSKLRPARASEPQSNDIQLVDVRTRVSPPGCAVPPEEPLENSQASQQTDEHTLTRQDSLEEATSPGQRMQ